jgi:hypothetical protein
VAEIAWVSVTDALAYWTVLSGPGLDVVSDVDDYLRHLRFGRSRAESTVKTYAGHLKGFHLWCQDQDLSWSQAAHELARYVPHLRMTPRQTAGRGQGELPADSAVAPALAAIRGFTCTWPTPAAPRWLSSSASSSSRAPSRAWTPPGRAASASADPLP